MKKVVKFGGSSLASAEQFRKVGDIIRADVNRRFVVPSAPGKRFKEDTKVTDLLYACYHAAEAGQEEEFQNTLKEIKARYEEIISGLGLGLSLEEDFQIIEENFRNKAGSDYAASRGEFLNGKVMADYLGYTFVDAAEVIFFDENGDFMAEKTNEVLGARLAKLENGVIPGFYGSQNGVVKTFSRGGSDVTGSIVARAAKASIYENWTDVSGFLLADPRIIDNPCEIPIITYKELRELSYMGASVLHEDAIFPVRKAGIPINIRNTNKPDDAGTLIVKTTCAKSAHTITGIAGRKGFIAVNIEKDNMNSVIGFGRRVLEAFEMNGISFEHVPSGIDTMSVIVSQEAFEEKEQAVLSAINRMTQPDELTLTTDLALIAVVGRNMKGTRGTARRVFRAMDDALINITMIDQGSDEENIIIGVKNADFENAIRAIYAAFVR